ncbi:MAG: dTDP-glucose 4,6-dehydratase [Sutterellaceae bacterium]|nr:dTDP-glucose 4,6-dehydratase [Sutterellaceae bacterium]
MILVTGGMGFIGSNFILRHFGHSDEPVLNLDLLTYAGNQENLAPLEGDARHRFLRADLRDRGLMRKLFLTEKPRAVVHFAAESHVDRSIEGPSVFFETNALGTVSLLEAARALCEAEGDSFRSRFRFLLVSTDEVYGSLGRDDPPFTEESPLRPNSPYSASKAASDEAARAWFRTYGLPVITTHCSNNYGPRQHPEKLIPLLILRGLEGKPVPVYGTGLNVRDWIGVRDHCAGVEAALERGRPGEAYNFGGDAERTNLEVVRAVSVSLEAEAGVPPLEVEFVRDRPGHDERYAIDSSKAARELGWKRSESFEAGIRNTVRWYLRNREWLRRAAEQSEAWRRSHYG